MLEKLSKNKKIWIPIIVVVIATVIFMLFVKNSDDTTGKGTSNTGSDTEESQENGLTEVPEDNSLSEDTITPPASWDGSEDASSVSGNNKSETTVDSDEKDKDNGSGTGMSSGDVLEDKDNKQFGTIF